jgi:hypothetical protein
MLSLCFIALGLLLIIIGMWGSTTLRAPYNAILAWGAPTGLLLVLAGIVQLIIPDFFA